METTTRHPLYQAALDAQDAFSAATAPYKDGYWTPVAALDDDAVRDAYRVKVAADTAWLDYMATHR